MRVFGRGLAGGPRIVREVTCNVLSQLNRCSPLWASKFINGSSCASTLTCDVADSVDLVIASCRSCKEEVGFIS